jgi:hypothetical protein
LDNVLVRHCDKNTIHIYKLNEKDTFCIPTHGVVPVIIDMGSSYSKSSKQLITSIEHYHRGLQPCVFDKMNDLHHFLLSCLSCLIDDDIEYYENVYYNVLCLLSPIPLYRNKGWKILDHSLVHKLEDFLVDNCPKISKDKDSYEMFHGYFRDMIETINGVVSVPFKELKREDVEAKLPKLWEELWSHLTTIISLESVSNDTECIYILKEIVGIYMSIKEGEQVSKCIEKVKNRLSTLIDAPDLRMINIKEMLAVLSELSDYLGGFYCMYLKKNMKVIDSAYEIMETGFNINGVEDFMKVLEKVMPVNLDVNCGENYIIYLFDAVKKERKREVITFTEKESNIFNDLTHKKKCEYLLNKMV